MTYDSALVAAAPLIPVALSWLARPGGLTRTTFVQHLIVPSGLCAICLDIVAGPSSGNMSPADFGLANFSWTSIGSGLGAGIAGILLFPVLNLLIGDDKAGRIEAVGKIASLPHGGARSCSSARPFSMSSSIAASQSRRSRD